MNYKTYVLLFYLILILITFILYNKLFHKNFLLFQIFIINYISFNKKIQKNKLSNIFDVYNFLLFLYMILLQSIFL